MALENASPASNPTVVDADGLVYSMSIDLSEGVVKVSLPEGVVSDRAGNDFYYAELKFAYGRQGKLILMHA